MKKRKRHQKKACILVLVCFSSLQVFSDPFLLKNDDLNNTLRDVSVQTGQQQVVKGSVTDQNGEPLPGVNVIVKGTTRGTTTDIDGNFELTYDQPIEVLVVSSIGFFTQEVEVGNRTIINVVMEAEIVGLEEIVVIGYGTVKKEDATGSVSVVRAEDFNQGVISSPQELLMGKASGVVITSNDGAPGAGSQIRIRGGSSLTASNDPLFIIDGIPITNVDIGGFTNPLTAINPNDIESITVLKDASATAIYGSRASNGVIIITTKKGEKGDLKVNYNGNVSLGTPIKFLEVMDGAEFTEVVQDQVTNHGLSDVALTRLGEANTDWQKEVYRNTISTDHNLSLSGAAGNIPLRASIGYTVDNGILDQSSMDRTSVSLNANPSFFDDHLTVGANLKGAFSNWNYSNTDAISGAVEFDPTQTVTNGNTRFGGYTTWTDIGSGIDGDPINIATHNPVARIAFRDNQSDAMRSIGSVTMDYKFHFLPELRANLNMGYDYTETKGDDLTDLKASWAAREPETNVKSYEHKLVNSLLDFYLNYVKDIEAVSSKVDFTAGYSWQHFLREGENANRPWEATDGVYVGADTTDYKREYYIVSFFGRLNYSLLDRYYITATLRNDGSSRFGEDTRWGLFPSFAFAWKINEELFMKNLRAISELKLRLGYGITGQQDVGNDFTDFYPYLPVYEISQSGAYYQFGDTYYPTLRPGAYNVDLKWEETITMNIGLDFGFQNNRFTGSIDAYKRETRDLINEIPIPAGTNFSNYLLTNVGNLENKGIEATLNMVAVSRSDLSWKIGVNFTYNKNEITKLTNVNDSTSLGISTGDISGGVDNKIQKNQVGYPTKTFFLFKQVYDVNGMPIEGLYIDKTGLGGTVSDNEANKYYMEKPDPDYVIGISSVVQYKQFDFSFSGRCNIGNYVYNNNNSNRALYENIYVQAGYLTNIPTSVKETGFSTAQFWSDIYLENASFFRMDNMSLGYRFNNLISQKLSGRVAFTVQNAFVITDYSGIDPEVKDGIDRNIYPRPRTYLLGFNIDF